MIDAATRRLVRNRALHRCEYCLLAASGSIASLQLEHIIPQKHGGTDAEDNLALACIDCNLHKGSNLSGLDPDTGALTELFHPRRHRWDDHFRWQGAALVGTTAIGRVTIAVLQINSEEQLQLRAILGQ